MKWQIIVILGIIALLIGMPIIGAALLVGATILTGPSLHPNRYPPETESQQRTFQGNFDNISNPQEKQQFVRSSGSQNMLRKYLERFTMDRFYVSKDEVREKIKTAGEYNDPVIVNVTARWLKDVMQKDMIIWLNARHNQKIYNINGIGSPTISPENLESFKNALRTGQRPSNYDNYIMFLRDPVTGGGHYQRVEWFGGMPDAGFRRVPSESDEAGMEKLYYMEVGGGGDCFYHVIRSHLGKTFFTTPQQVRDTIGAYIDNMSEDRFNELFLNEQLRIATDIFGFYIISDFVEFFNSLPVTRSSIRPRVNDFQIVEELIAKRQKNQPFFVPDQYLDLDFVKMWQTLLIKHKELAKVDKFDKVVILKIISREKDLKKKENDYMYKVEADGADHIREYRYETVNDSEMKITMQLEGKEFILMIDAITVNQLVETYENMFR